MSTEASSVPATPSFSFVRTAVAVIVSAVTMTVVGGIIAMAMSPVVVPLFGAFVRDPNKEGLNAPTLVGGYFVIALMLAMLHRQLVLPSRRSSAVFGLMLGFAVFLGDHLVTAGWSSIPALPMLISGVVDPVALALGAVVFAVISPNPREHA